MAASVLITFADLAPGLEAVFVKGTGFDPNGFADVYVESRNADKSASDTYTGRGRVDANGEVNKAFLADITLDIDPEGSIYAKISEGNAEAEVKIPPK